MDISSEQAATTFISVFGVSEEKLSWRSHLLLVRHDEEL
jgi:hypothetical protein